MDSPAPARKRFKPSPSTTPSSDPSKAKHKPLARAAPSMQPRDELRARGKQARAFVLGGAEMQQGQRQPQQSTKQKQLPLEHERLQNGYTQNDEEEELPLALHKDGLGPRPGVLDSSLRLEPARAGGEAVGDAVAPTKGNPPDFEVERRRREKVDLEREVEELEGLVERCQEEIEKEVGRGEKEELLDWEREGLSAFIAQLASEEKDADAPAEPPLSHLLTSFLPFTSLAPPPPQEPPKEAPSHRPVELKDPLPYLTMFTPLTYNTTLSLPQSPTSSNLTHQVHNLTITGPKSLLTARITLTLDTESHTILSLIPTHISPWATRGLSPFLATCADSKDLAAACSALETFWIISLKRAEFWQKCRTQLSHLISDGDDQDDEHNSKSSDRAALTRNLARDSITLRDKHTLLLLHWRITFDDTGEAQSDLRAEIAVPAVWREADESGAFGKIGGVFDELVRGRGVWGATRVVVGLVFGK